MLINFSKTSVNNETSASNKDHDNRPSFSFKHNPNVNSKQIIHFTNTVIIYRTKISSSIG